MALDNSGGRALARNKHGEEGCPGMWKTSGYTDASLDLKNPKIFHIFVGRGEGAGEVPKVVVLFSLKETINITTLDLRL